MAFMQRARGGGVRDGCLDLAPVSDDPGVGEQALDVALAVLGDPRHVPVGEGAAKARALAQDRQP
jgi:hypothetical protein